MTQLEIKSLSSPDVELGSDDVLGTQAVYFLVELEIGVAGEGGADLFHVIAATPEGLREDADRYGKGPVLSDRGLFVFADFSWEELDRRLSQVLESCRGRDWRESVLRLQRFFRWEFEDYVQDEGA